MTDTRRTVFATCAILMLLLWAPEPVVEAKDGALPDHIVARVSGRDLTFDAFCLTAATQKMHELQNGGSTVASALRQLMERRIIAQEAKRLGVDVTAAAIAKQFATYDRAIRERSNGNMTIYDVMRQKKTTKQEMEEELAHQLRQIEIAKHPTNLGNTLPSNDRERLSQLKVVLDKIVKRTVKHYYVKTAMQKIPSKGGQPGWIASVQVHPSVAVSPITSADFGRELVLRLGPGEVREILDRVCKTGLMDSAGIAISDADFDDEVAYARKIWDIERRLTTQEAFTEVTYDNFIEAKQGMSLAEMKRKRYYRGHFGLLRRFRANVTEEEVRKKWEEGKDSVWGKFILVTDIAIEFKQDNSRFHRGSVRHKKAAIQIARDVGRQLAAGVTFESIVRQINAKNQNPRTRDRTLKATKRRLRPTDADFLLYKRAFVMKDGDISSPIETLSHMHVLKRSKLYEAPTYAQVNPVVRELLTRQKARVWLEEKLKDPKYVRVNWPLPQRGGVNPFGDLKRKVRPAQGAPGRGPQGR